MASALIKTVAACALVLSFGLTACNPTWYYMSAVRQRLAYLRPITEERQITAVVFNDDGQVQAVAEYGLKDGNIVNFIGRETPTRGRELSVLEQIFGTIGRLPTDSLTGNRQTPGGGGGPGSGR